VLKTIGSVAFQTNLSATPPSKRRAPRPRPQLRGRRRQVRRSPRSAETARGNETLIDSRWASAQQAAVDRPRR
jgi:hypothetical protein